MLRAFPPSPPKVPVAAVGCEKPGAPLPAVIVTPRTVNVPLEPVTRMPMLDVPSPVAGVELKSGDEMEKS
jgi:hypothetical protein